MAHHPSIPPLVVLGEPLGNLLWREARKPTTQAYSLNLPSLQALQKFVEQRAATRIIPVVERRAARAARRGLPIRRGVVVRAATTTTALTRDRRGRRLRRLRRLRARELNRRRGRGEREGLAHRV